MSHAPFAIRSPSGRWLALLAAGVAGLTGYFGPWSQHQAAGLVITGLDLAEYVKFLPEVMGGQIILQRQAFYGPLAAGSLIATLIASRRTVPRPLRALLLLTAIPLALAQLPPAWSPGTLLQPEFRIEVVTIAFCLTAIPLVTLIRHLPDRPVSASAGLLALIALLWPAWSFLQVRPAIGALYGAALPLGWGFWMHLAGFFGLAFLSAAFTLLPRQ